MFFRHAKISFESSLVRKIFILPECELHVAAIYIRCHDFNEFDLTLHDFEEFDFTLHDLEEFYLSLHDSRCKIP